MRIPRGACPHWLIRTPLSTLVTSDRVKQCLVHTSGAPNEGIGKPNVHVDSSQAGRNARTHRNLEWEGKDVTVTQHRFTGLDFYLRQQVYILQFSSS